MQAPFRPATTADEPTLLELMREFYQEGRMPFQEGAARVALRGVLADPSRGRALLIEVDGAVAGYLVVCFGWSLEFHGRDASSTSLRAQPLRGQGIGPGARGGGGSPPRAAWRPPSRGRGSNTRAQSVYADGFADRITT